MTNEPVDRNDLSLFKDWISAEFKAVDARLDAIRDSVDMAREEQERKNVELNDVRTRFVDRRQFEDHIRRVDDQQAAERTRRRGVWLAVALVALAAFANMLVNVVQR